MYAYIRGTVAETDLSRAVIEAAGVGYELICSAMTLKKLLPGEPAKLYTHLYLADGVMALYGFSDPGEREMFRRLLGVTRVGPKLAVAVLSHLTPQDVAAAIMTENAAAFDHVPGLGRKTAQRLLLELKEHVSASDMLGGGTESPEAPAQDMRAEAVAALVSLGYDGLSASRAVTSIKEADSVEALITRALRTLAK